MDSCESSWDKRRSDFLSAALGERRLGFAELLTFEKKSFEVVLNKRLGMFSFLLFMKNLSSEDWDEPFVR